MNRKRRLAGAAALAAVLLLAPGSSAVPGDPGKGRDFVRGHVVVKFRNGAAEWEKGRVRALVSGRKGRRLERVGLEKLYLPPGWDEERAVEVLERDPSVQYAGLDQKVELLGAPVLLGVMPALVPGDARFSEQWHLDFPPVTGMFVTASNPVNVDVDIDAPEGWAVMEGSFDSSMSAVVGVIDSGCGEQGTFNASTGYLTNHEDLPGGVLFLNPVELPADGLDSPLDVNAFEDDTNGWDFADADNIPADVGTTYHGTLICGITGAGWDNGVGVSGIGKDRLDVLPLRFAISFFEVVAAVEYAMDLVEDGHPVRVLNMSFKSEFGQDPGGLREAVAMAGSYGIAVVAAAGNDNGNNNDDFLDRVWPAEYTRDPGISNVLAVAATGTDGTLAGFSNFGPGSVQIAAPGDDILSTYDGSNGYGLASGTSFSTPIAGAVLGLVMAAHPGLTPAEAIDRVVQGGDFDARLAGLVQSGRRVNLAGALAPFAPYSGLAYLDSTVTVAMYADSLSRSYGSVLGAEIDMSFGTTPAAAGMAPSGATTLVLTPLAPGIAQFTLTFDGVGAPVGTYDTGPWRVTAVRPFTAQVQAGSTVMFRSLLPAAAASVSWSVSDASVASITTRADGTGVLEGLQPGDTRVILFVDGVPRDYSGQILVLKRPPSGGGGGCGTTLPPGEDPMGGLLEVILAALFLFGFRKVYQAEAGPRSKIQGPRVYSRK